MKTLRYILLSCFLLPGLLLLAQDYEIYVSDAGNYNNPPWQIVKYDQNGENPETFIEDEIIWPQDILFLEDQEIVLISNLTAAGYISKHNVQTGAYIGNFAEDINGPTRMKIGDDGLLYVLQWNNGSNKVLRFELNGTFVDEFTSIGIPQSIGLDWDTDGNLYVSTYSGKYVQKFNTDGNDMGAFISTDLSGPTNIWFEENGDLLVNDYLGAAVKRFSPSGEYQGIYISGLFYPEGVAYLENGNLLIGNGGTSAVKMFDADGNFIVDLIESGAGDLLTPNAVVIRDLSPVSVPEPKIKSSFIYPSPGRDFYIDPLIKDNIKQIKILDINGKVINEMVMTSQHLIWRAGDQDPGVYLIIVDLLDGENLYQKVIVK